MRNNGYEWGLGAIMAELNLSQNQLHLHTGIRPDTLRDLKNGDTQRIHLDNVTLILDALNEAADRAGVDREYNVEDLIRKTPRG